MEQEKTNNNLCGKGSLWKKKAKNGKPYLSGSMIIQGPNGAQKFHVNVFTNDQKNGNGILENDSKKIAPDCAIYIYPFVRTDLG